MAVNFVVCFQKNDLGDITGDDLRIGHLYEVVEAQAGHGMIRIIDDSGEDFLYPERCFHPVTLNDAVARCLRQDARRDDRP